MKHLCRHCQKQVTARLLPKSELPWTREIFVGPDHDKQCRYWSKNLIVTPLKKRKIDVPPAA